MKRKEKEHLKADPFVHFVEKAIAFLKNNRRLILAGAGNRAAIGHRSYWPCFFSPTLAPPGENKLYASAFSIRSNANMSIDQKISQTAGNEI